MTSFSRKDDGNYSWRWQCCCCLSLILYFLSWMRSVVLTVSLFYASNLRISDLDPIFEAETVHQLTWQRSWEQTVGNGFLFGWDPAMHFSWNVSQIDREQIRPSSNYTYILYLSGFVVLLAVLCIPALVFQCSPPLREHPSPALPTYGIAYSSKFWCITGNMQ